MNGAKDLSQLARLAQLALDHKLGVLKESSERLEHSRMQLAALNQTTMSVDLDAVTLSRVGVDYERWADSRRSELNLVISRQTAVWLEACSEAKTAFGRVQALTGLLERSGNDRR